MELECFKMEEGKSLVRVFNALPNGDDIDVYIGGIPFFKNLKYREFSPYIFLIKNIHSIDIFKSGTMDSLIKTSVPLPKDEIFTIAVTGNLGKELLVFVEETLDIKPSKEKAVARTINLAPNLSSINLLYNDTPGVNNIEYRDQMPYAYLPPGEYNITVEDTTTGNYIVSQKFEFKVMRIYGIYIIQKGIDKFEIVQSVDGNTYVCRKN